MQFLQGKSIQHEFCHLLNMLLDSARQVVVAADRAPWELESLDPRVRSRLQGGVAIEIEAPDYEMRLEMLRQRLAIAQIDDARSTSARTFSPMSPRTSPRAAASWRARSTSCCSAAASSPT
jgi:chromosomal replication initiation ATPase DnaA